MSLQIGSINNNPFSFKGIQAAPAVKRQVGGANVSATQHTSGNPFAQAVSNNSMFAGNTYGVNANIGIGETSYTAPQAGYKAGVSRTLAFA